jgi:hypothetical protein
LVGQGLILFLQVTLLLLAAAEVENELLAVAVQVGI